MQSQIIDLPLGVKYQILKKKTLIIVINVDVGFRKWGRVGW